MNPITNELIDIKGSDAFEEMKAKIKGATLNGTLNRKFLKSAKIEALSKLTKNGFEPLPKELQRSAKFKLNGKRKAKVSRTSNGKLSKWAVKRRKEIAKEKKMVLNCNTYYNQ